MDNCTRDNSPRPDPPGSSDFVFRYIDANHDGGMESISTLTDPPPIQPPLDVPNISTNSPPIKSLLGKQSVSSSFAPNSPTWTIDNYKQNTNNGNDGTALSTSSDPPINDNATLCPDEDTSMSAVFRNDGTALRTSSDPPTNNNDTLCPDDDMLLSTVFPQHCLMMKHFQEYATMKGFLHAEHTKQSFTTTEFAKLFPGESIISTMTLARRGYLRCSPKSHGRTKGAQCCFNLPYFWCTSHNNFMLRSEGSNLSHNHRLLSKLTVIDGRAIVNLESSLHPEEFNSIKEQSRCRVHIPQMRVNLEESFPGRSFSRNMLHRMRLRFINEKYGADGHNLRDLFMKGDRIRCLGGKFLVVPSSSDFSIETIHCQTKLMAEYATVYGEDGFKMADGTHKITKYDMTFVFWMVIDCLLKSKFVGYTANFTENSDVIIDGAHVFFHNEAPRTSLDVESNKILVGGIPGFLILLLTMI